MHDVDWYHSNIKHVRGDIHAATVFKGRGAQGPVFDRLCACTIWAVWEQNYENWGLFGNGTTRNGPGLHACILEHDLDLSSVSVSQQVVDVWGLLSLIDCVAAGLYLDSDERGARHSAAYLEPSNNNTIRRSAQLVPLNSQLLAFSVCNDCPPPADNKLDSPCLFVEQPVAFGVPRPLNPSKHA